LIFFNTDKLSAATLFIDLPKK